MKWWDGHSCNSAMCVFSRSDQVNMALGCFRCHLGIIHALWATFTAGMGRRLRVLWSTSLRRWRIRLPENLCSQWCSMWDNKTLWLLMVASCLDHQPTGRGSCSRIGAWSKGQGQGTRAANQQSRARGAVVRGAFRYPKKWKREQREVLWHKAFMQDMQAWPMARLYLNFAIFGGRIMWVPVGACIYIWWPWHLQIAHYQHFNEIAFTVQYMPLHLNPLLFCQANVINNSLGIIFSLPKLSFLIQSYWNRGLLYDTNPTNALSREDLHCLIPKNWVIYTPEN